MRTLLFTLIANCLVQVLPAQSSGLHIFPDPSFQTQCPSNEITYYIFPWVSSCPASFTVVGGEVLRQSVYSGKLKVTIVWQDPVDSMPGRLALAWGDSTCGNGAFSQTWEFPISSKPAYKPIVVGSSHSYPMGIGARILLEASIEAPVDTSIAILPPVFEWQAPPEWNIFGYYSYPDVGVTDSKKALYISLYNPLTEGCVRVRSQSTCGKWSEWTDYCLWGTIPSPCPLRLGREVFLCGDTTGTWVSIPNFTLPQIPQLPPYVWSTPEYTWTVPPGWTINSTQSSTVDHITVKPDGHSSGLVSVSATTNGVTSPQCDYPAIFVSADPATAVFGADYVCQTGDFWISPWPPDHSSISWEVEPVDLDTPQIIFPDHGSGTATFQVSDISISGYFRITYTITNDCGVTKRSKDFFVGKPFFSNTTLDGAAYGAQPLCPGSHGINTEVLGLGDLPITWSASSGLTGYPQHESFVFALAPSTEGFCPTVTASADNVCGTTILPLEFCPRSDCSPPPPDLLVYPNPAYLIVSLEATSTDASTEDYTLIENVEIFNYLGQLVAIWQGPGHRIVKAIVDLPNGVYTLRATILNQTISKRLVIARLF